MVLSFLVGSLFTARLFIWPPGSRPDRVDAVVVLSGDHGERLPEALRLIRRGVSSTLVLDGTPDFPLVLELCQERQAFEVICLRPEPDSTRAEARAAGRLAAERRWKRLVVVTTTYHVTRSGLLFRRCFDGRVATVGADPPRGWRASTGQIAHEWFGVAYALTFGRGC